MSPKKIVLIIVAVVLSLIVITAAIFAASVMAKYNKTAYEYQPPVERESEYIMPDYPEVIIDTDGIWQEGVDETAAEETEETATPEEITETEEIVETVPAETEEDTVAETQPIPVETVKPAETIASIVNDAPTANTTAPAAEPNRAASFGNTANTVSVYGSVPIYKVEQKDPDITNYLVLGTDTRDVTADRGRSDTMIIVSYNSKTGSVKLTSLLRDSLVPIEGYGWNRINTTYFFGGVGLAINTVNQLYNLDIQNFIVIDFNGVKDFINYAGGVDITLTEEEAALYTTQAGKEIKAGLNHMSGNLALLHMRNRTIGSDFGRTQRQRDVITALVTQVLTQKSATEIYDIVDYGFSLIKTNISATDMVSLAASLLSNSSKLQFETQNVPYTDAYQFGWYNGMAIISYDIAAAAERVCDFIYGE